MRRPPTLLLTLLVALAVVASACAGSRTDEEVLRASGGGSAGAPGGDGPTTSSPGATGGRTVGGGGSSTGGTGDTGGGTAEPGGSGPAPTVPANGSKPITTPNERGPIVIASVGDYSGPAGAVLGQIPKGVQLWAQAVNAAGGLFGRQVQVIVADDGGDPATYGATVQDLVQNRHVVAFVGNGAGLGMDGGISYLERAGVPVFGSECSRAEWYQHRVFFPQCPSPDDLAVGLVRTGVRVTHQTRVGLIICTEAAACQNVKRVVLTRSAEAGAQVVYHEDVSFTQIDFTAQCRNAQKAGVQLMLVGADANTWLRVAQACARQGFYPQYIGEATGIPQEPHGVPGLDDIIATGEVFAAHSATGPGPDAFQAAVRRFSDGHPNQGEALGWAAGKLFELAATRAAAATGSVQPKTLLEAGHTIKGETLGGLTPALDFTGPTPRNAPCTFTEQSDPKGGWTAPLGSAAVCP